MEVKTLVRKFKKDNLIRGFSEFKKLTIGQKVINVEDRSGRVYKFIGVHPIYPNGYVLLMNTAKVSDIKCVYKSHINKFYKKESFLDFLICDKIRKEKVKKSLDIINEEILEEYNKSNK